jgi:hypothetical protein
MTLIAQARTTAADMRAIRAFGTPTVFHFCTALIISALVCAPWRSVLPFSLFLGLYGAAGLIYSIGIVWHARKATYNPDLEDWIWYTGMPILAHSVLLTGAILIRFGQGWPEYLIAADALLFLFLGIRNAWDTVTYIAVTQLSGGSGKEEDTRNS